MQSSTMQWEYTTVTKNTTATNRIKGKIILPMRIWDGIIPIPEYHPYTSENTPVNKVWAENSRTKIIYPANIKKLRL